MTKAAKFFLPLLWFALAFPIKGYGFYEDNTLIGETEVKGFISASAARTDNPDNLFFYKHDRDRFENITARLLIDNYFTDELSLEFNGLVSYSLNTFSIQTETSKYKTLEFQDLNQRDSYKSTFALIDRLNLNYSKSNYNFKLGRAPQNLTIQYFFRPNDFFQPFSENTFFRDFKEGVDSARFDYKITNLSELTLLAVAGYGAGNDFESSLTSLIAQLKTPVKEFEISIIAGRVYDKKILGGYLQGELFNSITMRLEGHGAKDKFTDEKTNRAGVALEKYFSNDLSITVEGFYNGEGLKRDEYNTALLTDTLPSDYLGKKYLSVGGGKLLTPLVNLQGAVFFNLTDSSKMLSLYSTYSLSNESDISFSANFPYGHKSKNLEIKSEYGMAPYSLGLDFRIYF